MKQNALCECVFKMGMESFQVVVLVYVDGLVILLLKENGAKWVKDKVWSSFRLLELGEIS